jgi:diguanylate cyclase (GGDEF)-like protein
MEAHGYLAAFANGWPGARARRDLPLIAGTAAAFGLAVFLAISLTRNGTQVAAIWPANGILLAALLNCPRRISRFALVLACMLTAALAGLLNGDSAAAVVAGALIGPLECTLAFLLLKWSGNRGQVELTQIWTLVRFVSVVVLAPVLPAAAGAYAATHIAGDPFSGSMMTWYLSDTLGLLVVTPAILLMANPNTARVAPSTESIARHFLLLTAVAIIVFVQVSVPLLFLLIPVSVLIAFRLGPRYAAVATLWLSVVSIVCTYQGLGPAALMPDAGTRIWVVQLFCFVNLLTTLAVAAELEDRERLRSELERMSALASDRRRQLDTALDAMSQGVCLFDRNSRVVVRNSQFLAIYGLTEQAVPAGMTLSDLLDVCRTAGAVPESDGKPVVLNVDNDIEQQLVGGRYIRINQRVLSDGGVICTYTDYTAEKKAEAELLHRTLHDVLTGLPNRRLLVDRIDQALAAARRGRHTAVMLIDIDHFKSINDNMGHAAGDEILRVVSNRLRACVRETDTIARLGGDEFALLVSDGDQPCDTTQVARRLLESIRRPVMIEGKPVRIGMSIGIAHPPLDGTTTDEILKSADVALYKAKRNGRGNFAYFDAAEDAGACSARRIESELRRAIDEKQFTLVYQPITTSASGDIAGVEALIRWHHAELGTIPPAEFIPIAERNGLICEIGDWVLDQACRDAVKMPSHVKVSVNLSRAQVYDRKVVSRVAQVLTRTGLPPHRLELEMTETAILDNEAAACRTLQELGTLGVSVAIDDFGVGQSALSCLRSLPIGRIKIDRSFVSDVDSDSKARSIFVAVVSLAKSLGISTTAEGIETEQQRLIAALSGCDQLQGYLLGRPQERERLPFPPDAAAISGGLLGIAS